MTLIDHHQSARTFLMRVSLCVLLTAVDGGTGLWADDSPSGLVTPEGFQITQFADDDLAPDIYSLTIDARGRVVVAGRGYVRILIDTDEDGVADRFRQFADGPANGAMGMCWEGGDLICTGDAGLLRYRDADDDDRADGPPQTLLPARTGGEHDIHAIRKGPDGWWYLLGGNGARLDERYVTLSTSPVTSPAAGALLRLTPDFRRSEVIADGFRNPYDFAFGKEGRIFTYDSDGERDISLPWYRPTRVFEILPGASAGWISRSWKHPAAFFDMPPVTAAFGRGSPTGVECYRHTQFPEKYHDGLFVLDWTYGRVMFLPSGGDDDLTDRQPEPFMGGAGSFGFAPTDAAVGPDGSLYVSVGGRGTRGGVYRIRWKDGASDALPVDPLRRCLLAPQPLSSWSRREWEPVAGELGQTAFERVALDQESRISARIRAIEILTERFGGTDSVTIADLARSEADSVRARTAWMIGRTGSGSTPVLGSLLQDREPTVVRAALEALFPLLSERELTVSDSGRESLRNGLAAALSQSDRYVRQLAARVLARLDDESFEAVCDQVDNDDWPAQIAIGLAMSLRQPGFARGALDRAVRCLQSGPVAWHVEAARLAQLALGDVGPGEHAPVFDGYAGTLDLDRHAEDLRPLMSTLRRMYPTGRKRLDRELSRLMAIAAQGDEELLDVLLSQIAPESHPVEDIHVLIVAARLPVRRTAGQRQRLAEALVGLDAKFASRQLPRDLNWDDRIGEMYAELVTRDRELPSAVIVHPEFGEPGHVLFAAGAEGKLRDRAVDAIVTRAASDPDYGWTSDVVRFLGSSDREDVRDLLRPLADNFGLSGAILTALARTPVPQDRRLFVEGLDSADLGVLRTVLQALDKLGSAGDPAEQVALVRTLRRLGASEAERRLKRSIHRRLQTGTGQFTAVAVPDAAAIARWTEWVEEAYPEQWARQSGTTATDVEDLRKQLSRVDWSSGDVRRGAELFDRRSCRQCHGGRRALGPDLNGVARRFSREDLYVAIAMPDKDVSPRYQTTLIVTGDGQPHTGIIIYESIDGLLLRNRQGETIRIESGEIEARRQLTASLMPAGLLKDLTPDDLADLYAYLSMLE